MKTKKFSKKLELNKKTIAVLNSDGMKDVYGGKPKPSGYITCGSTPGLCCIIP